MGRKVACAMIFASQGGFREMLHFPQEDLPAVKECKGPWAQSPPEWRMALQLHTGGLLGKSEDLLKTISEPRWGRVELMPRSRLPCEHIWFCSVQSGFVRHAPRNMGTDLLFFISRCGFFCSESSYWSVWPTGILESRSLLFWLHLGLHGGTK